MSDTKINMNVVCKGCVDRDSKIGCKVWGSNAPKQIAIRVGGECLRNQKIVENTETKKINPIKMSKRGE